jgi:hypothetical protein
LVQTHFAISRGRRAGRGFLRFAQGFVIAAARRRWLPNCEKFGRIRAGQGIRRGAAFPLQPGSTLLPGLAGVEGGPEFLCGSCDLSVLGIAERDSCDVPCQQDPGR